MHDRFLTASRDLSQLQREGRYDEGVGLSWAGMVRRPQPQDLKAAQAHFAQSKIGRGFGRGIGIARNEGGIFV